MGCSWSLVRNCECDPEGRKLSWLSGAEEVGFIVFPERCNVRAISISNKKNFFLVF